MKKILFISHDAHLAGAQILLLNFLRWFKTNHKEFQFDVLLADGGPLTADFEKLTKVYQLPLLKRKSLTGRYWHKAVLQKFHHSIQRENYDLIYNNTFSNGQLVEILKQNRIPVITHVHELDYWIKKNGKKNEQQILAATDYYLTASHAVSTYLTENHMAAESIVETVYEYIDTKALSDPATLKSIKQYLNLPEDSRIVAASGRENFRKGKDWFVPVAISVLSRIKNQNVHFIWIGGSTSEAIQFDLIKSGYQDFIHFVDHIPDANRYFNAFDLFLMLSREDPFPIVNLEAGLWEVPVICFENAGGTEELIADRCGIAVPYGNLGLVSDAVITLLEDETLRKELGQNLKRKIIALYDTEVVAPKMVQAIYKVMKKNAHE